MNSMTGGDFDCGDGICTKGINCYLTKELDYSSYLKSIKPPKTTTHHPEGKLLERDQTSPGFTLYLDCQGMLSSERPNKDFDEKSGTFLMKICDVLILNFSAELEGPLSEIIQNILYTSRQIDLKHNELFSSQNSDFSKII